MTRSEIAAITLCLLSVGCSSPKTAVPVRPAMPTESLEKGVSIDTFTAACIAEIERRESYEIMLRAALAICNGDSKDDGDKR